MKNSTNKTYGGNLNTHLNNFLHHKKVKQNKSDKTISTYSHQIDLFYRYLSSISITDITMVTRQVFEDYMATVSHKSPNTTNLIIATVDSMWSYLKDEKVVSENIAENMPRRVVQKCVPKFIKPENVQTLIDKSEEINNANYHSKVRTELAIKMLVSTGLRLSELVNVRHSDIDGTELVVNKGKGNKQRVLPLHPDLVDLIKDYANVKRRYGYSHDTYLFMSRNNKQITELVMYRDIKAMLTSIGREDLSPHKLRATFANILASNEVPLQLIQDLLGHSNFNTTKIYLDLTKKKQEAVNSIDFFGKRNIDEEE